MMDGAIEWLTDNWPAISAVVVPVAWALVNAYVRSTPTPKDDELVGAIGAALGLASRVSILDHHDADDHGGATFKRLGSRTVQAYVTDEEMAKRHESGEQ